MKTNLKVLVLGFLVSCASLSNAATHCEKIHGKWIEISESVIYHFTPHNWMTEKKYFGGVAAALVATAGITYLICKKINAKKAKVVVAELQ